MALFSSFFGCFTDSTSRIAVEGDDKFVAVTACTLDRPEKNCESISHSKSGGDISKISYNRRFEGSPVLVLTSLSDQDIPTCDFSALRDKILLLFVVRYISYIAI